MGSRDNKGSPLFRGGRGLSQPHFRRPVRTVFLVFFLGIFLGHATLSQAQPRWQIGLDGLLGVPQGAFKNNVDNTAAGVSGYFSYRLKQTPISLGFELSFLRYGHESRTEPFSTTIPDVTVDVNTSNDILLMHFLVRLQSQGGRFRPYLDGLVGANYLFTHTAVDADGSEPQASSTNLDDFVLSFGGGGGLMITFYEAKKSTGKRSLKVMVNVRVRYIFGSEAEYLAEGSIQRQGGNVFLDVSKSRTDLLVLYMGIGLGF